MFKAFHLLTLTSTDAAALREAIGETEEFGPLKEFIAVDPAPSQWRKLGIEHLSLPYEGWAYGLPGGDYYLQVQTRERILPGQVIRREMDKRIRHLREVEGRELSRREKSQVRDFVEADLLPTSHIRHSTIPVLIIERDGQDYLVVGTSSAKACEEVIDVLRGAYNIAFHWAHVAREHLIPQLLKDVLDYDIGEDHLTPLDTAKFKGRDRVVTVKNVEMHSDTVNKLRVDGFKATEMTLQFEEEAKYKLTSKGVFGSFKMLDLSSHSDLEGVDDSDEAAMFVATLLIYVEQIKRIAAYTFDVMAELAKSEKKEGDGDEVAEDEAPTQRAADEVSYWWHRESDSVFKVVGSVSDDTATVCVEIDEDKYNALINSGQCTDSSDLKGDDFGPTRYWSTRYWVSSCETRVFSADSHDEVAEIGSAALDDGLDLVEIDKDTYERLKRDIENDRDDRNEDEDDDEL